MFLNTQVICDAFDQVSYQNVNKLP